jgi:RNA polymerase sigma-70 factor, ECF subfamily
MPYSLSADALEDARLVRSCRRGDLDAFAELVEKYQDGVYGVVYRMTGDREEARDIAQDTFVKALDGMGRFREHMPFRPWLYRIATNASIDHLRSARRTRQVALESCAGGDSTPLAGVVRLEPRASLREVPEQAALDNELREIVNRAIDDLPEQYKAVVVLHHLEGLSYTEVGKVLGVPGNTAKTWGTRARALLCDSLKEVV